MNEIDSKAGMNVIDAKKKYREGQLIAFVFIWIGLIFFTVGEYRAYRKLSAAEPES